MFKRKRPGPWPPTREEPLGTAFKAVISNIQEIVTGGILRAGKTAYGSGTGFWLGKDPADNECKFDIGTPTDYFRYDETNGVQIKADGSAITNIDGADIQTGTVTADAIAAGTITATEIAAGTITATEIAANAVTTDKIAANAVTATKINVTNLQAVTAQTGALTVDDTLTMGEDGIITWMSGAAKITDDYMDVALTTSNRYAFRFLDGEVVHAYLGAYKSTNLTQLSIEVIGPAEDKYAKFAIAAVEWAGADPETTDFIVRSDTGVAFSALNYAATRRFKVDTMDVWLTNKLGIGIATPQEKIDLGTSGALKMTETSITELYLENTGLRMKNIYTGAGWARPLFTYENSAGTDYFQFGAYGSGQTFTNVYIGPAYNTAWQVWKSGLCGFFTISPTAAVDINSDIIRLRTPKTPASAGAAGNQGDICWDASYIYICTATNTWERAAIATW